MSQALDNDKLTLNVGKRDHIAGLLNAPVLLLEYGDYQSPHCFEAYKIVKKLQRQLGEKLCFVYRHFPLTQIHPQAQKAALVAEGAGSQGKFWQMHDILFEHQQALDNGHLVEYALKLDLNISQFLQEMSARLHAPRVQEDFESGISSGVISTPTFFINGIRYLGTYDLENLIQRHL
jgi:protein-disulfide isomerase